MLGQSNLVYRGALCPHTLALRCKLRAGSVDRRLRRPSKTVCSSVREESRSVQGPGAEASKRHATAPLPAANPSPTDWKVGDTVTVMCLSWTASGCIAVDELTGKRLLIPFAHFPSMTPTGERRSPQEIEREFHGTKFLVQLIDSRPGSYGAEARWFGSAVQPMIRQILSAKEGELVEVYVHRADNKGLVASYEGILVFVPQRMISHAFMMSHEELIKRYLYNSILVSLISFIDVSGNNSIIGSMIHRQLQQLDCKAESCVEVWVQHQVKGGLMATYKTLPVFIPSAFISECQEPFGLVGTKVMISFLYVTFGNVVGSMLPLSMDVMDCQIGDEISVTLVTCRHFTEDGCFPMVRLPQCSDENLFVPYSHFPRLLPDGSHKTSQELAEEFAGRKVDMLIQETPMKGRPSIVGCPNASLARKLLSTTSSLATVTVYSHQYNGLKGCLEGVWVLIPWTQIPGGSTFMELPAEQQSPLRKTELAQPYKGKEVAVTLLGLSKGGDGLIGSMIE